MAEYSAVARQRFSEALSYGGLKREALVVARGVTLMSRQAPEMLLGRYVLQEEVNKGGTATVFRALDVKTDDRVAVKRLDRDRQLPEIAAEAFRRELEALQNLVHPNILRIRDHGEDERQQPFLVLDWMEHDLLEFRSRGSQAFDGWDDFAERILLPVVDALAYAHANDICHRDVKPGNILVSREGVPRIADFGISKLKRCLQPRITLSEFMSIPYAPPEPDDGSYSYARDVFAVGVLCLWALSDVPVNSYDEIPEALSRFDAHPDIANIVKRCLSIDPHERPQTAGLLAHEFSKVQNLRERVFAEKERSHCVIWLTHNACSILEEDLPELNRSELERFVEKDINADTCVQRFRSQIGTSKERVEPGHFVVLGGTYRYHLAVDNRGRDCFAILGLLRPEVHVQQRVKHEALVCPVLFQFWKGSGCLSVSDAEHVIETALAIDEEKRRLERLERRENELFDGWANLLSSRMSYQRELSTPIPFSDIEVRDQFVKLFTDADTTDVQLDEPRVIETDLGRRITGEVYQIDGDGVVLHCASADLKSCPRDGVARLDNWASERAIERQRIALARVRHGNATSNELGALLVDPSKAQPPDPVDELSEDTIRDLDESKQLAVRAALGTTHALLVQGPPGTGKTRFIANLIREYLRREPGKRVVLVSQTHVAIDNALERLAKLLPDEPMVRVARADSTNVASTSAPYLLARQQQRWRVEVSRKSTDALLSWAREIGIEPDDLQVGSLLKQISRVRADVVRLRDRIQDLQEQLDELEKQRGTIADEQLDADVDPVKGELEEYRTQLDSSKTEVDRLSVSLKELTKEADAFLELSGDEMMEWSAALLGDSEEARKAESLLRLQSEWLERFGRDASFTAALFERTRIITGTCIGLTSVQGTDEIEYDICIIDEASKATATEALVPMVRSRRWILVGDSRQLPPFEEEVVRRRDLRERYDLEDEEVTESMFERLRRLLPKECQTTLRCQYRMAPPIGRLISECFYDGELENEDSRGLDEILVAVKGRAVAWLTTRERENRGEQRAGSSFVNTCESEHIVDVLHEFERALSSTDRSVSVLVLSGYNAQVRYLERSVDRESRKLTHLSVECCSIDAVQGREADVVIFSVTRSNDDRTAGFLRVLARINVALSRAREVLIVVGDDRFVERAKDSEPLQRVLRHICSNQDECLFEVVQPTLKLGGRG